MMTKAAPMEPIFILAGQSNMVGRCDEAFLPDPFQPSMSKDVDFRLCWDNDHNFGEGCSSNGEFRSLQAQHSPGLQMELFGPEMGLARTLEPRLVGMGIQRAHFIKFSMGSTSLHTNWNPSNAISEGKMTDIGYYETFLKYCQDSLDTLMVDQGDNSDCSTKIQNRKLCGFFWLQGESDSSKAKDANAYLSNFKHFAQTFREDLGHSNLPIVVSPVVWHGKKVNLVNEALERAESEIEHCTCVDRLDSGVFGVQGENAGVCTGHLTPDGLCEIGRRMGEAISLSAYSDYC